MPGTVTGASHIKSTKISILGDQDQSVGDKSPKSHSTNRTGTEESKMTASQISQNKAKATGVFNLKSILGKGMFGAVQAATAGTPQATNTLTSGRQKTGKTTIKTIKVGSAQLKK